jgi:NADH-quinone oxidoreductase subunit M
MYALTLYRRVVFGELVNPKLADITDLDWREVAIFAPLIASTLILGVQPGLVFDVTHASVDQLVSAYQAAIGG